MSRSSPRTLLQQVLQGTANAKTPREAAGALLAACVEWSGARGGVIYLLELDKALFAPFVSTPSGDDSVQHGGVPVADARVPLERLAPLGQFLRQSEEPTTQGDGVVIYASRGSSCIGAIRLDGPAQDALTSIEREDLLASANVLVSVYEDEFAFNLLSSIQHPLDFAQSDEEFFAQIAVLIAVSSKMEFVSLRERSDDGDALRCLALWGFPSDLDKTTWDLEPVDRFPPFVRALHGETVVVPSMAIPETAAIREMSWSAPVRSFVAMPINVGLDTFGVLSLGARLEFDYAPLEQRGFESIANGVGVSITNFRNSHRLSRQVGEYTEAAVAITAVEAARAARHEAIGHIDTCNIKLAALHGRLGRHAASYEPEIDAISSELGKVGDALDKIRLATKPLSLDWSTVSLRRLWDEARTAVAGRLGEERIDVRVNGADAQVYAIPDRLRHVFLNLLLNSIDAFRDGKKSGRRIELTIERTGAKAREVELVYRDNATGINPQRLRLPDEVDGSLPLKQLLFEPGVTSKRDGSGFGLWLVRNILDEHHGSIDLTDYRGGVTFVIRLPKPDDSARLLGGT